MKLNSIDRLFVSIQDEQGKNQVIASGYELERSQEILYSDQSQQYLLFITRMLRKLIVNQGTGS